VDRLLNRISGKVCIDAEEFEIARAEVFLGSEVNLLGGRRWLIKKTCLYHERTRMGDGIWFNTFSSGDFEDANFSIRRASKQNPNRSTFVGPVDFVMGKVGAVAAEVTRRIPQCWSATGPWSQRIRTWTSVQHFARFSSSNTLRRDVRAPFAI